MSKVLRRSGRFLKAPLLSADDVTPTQSPRDPWEEIAASPEYTAYGDDSLIGALPAEVLQVLLS